MTSLWLIIRSMPGVIGGGLNGGSYKDSEWGSHKNEDNQRSTSKSHHIKFLYIPIHFKQQGSLQF